MGDYTGPVHIGYYWRCTYDPTGTFRGRLFRWSDIVLTPDEKIKPENNWAEGLEFVHILTGKHFKVKHNQPVGIQAARKTQIQYNAVNPARIG